MEGDFRKSDGTNLKKTPEKKGPQILRTSKTRMFPDAQTTKEERKKNPMDRKHVAVFKHRGAPILKINGEGVGHVPWSGRMQKETKYRFDTLIWKSENGAPKDPAREKERTVSGNSPSLLRKGEFHVKGGPLGGE